MSTPTIHKGFRIAIALGGFAAVAASGCADEPQRRGATEAVGTTEGELGFAAPTGQIVPPPAGAIDLTFIAGYGPFASYPMPPGSQIAIHLVGPNYDKVIPISHNSYPKGAPLTLPCDFTELSIDVAFNYLTDGPTLHPRLTSRLAYLVQPAPELQNVEAPLVQQLPPIEPGQTASAHHVTSLVGADVPAGQVFRWHTRLTAHEAASSDAVIEWYAWNNALNVHVIKPQCAPVVTQIAAGGSSSEDFSLALKSDGTVWAWGRNLRGQLGMPPDINKHPVPTQVNGLPVITRIAAGGQHVLAIDSAGKLWAWGENGYRQLGQTTFPLQYNPVPTKVAGIPSDLQFVAVSAGSLHSAALTNDGQVYVFGLCQRIGNGSSSPTACTPQKVTSAALQNVVELVAGSSHTVARLGNGDVYAWGTDFYGELGNGWPTSDQYVPVKMSVSGATAVAAGGYTSFAVTSVGTLGTGDNQYHQLALGVVPPTYMTAPTYVLQGAGKAIHGLVRLTSNNAHVLAIDGGGLPYAWGYNAYGQIANGTKINGRYAMPMLAGPSQPFGAVIDVATSGSHSLLLRASDKSVWAVGRNFHGQLGYQELNQLNQPITPDKVYPVQVQGL